MNADHYSKLKTLLNCLMTNTFKIHQANSQHRISDGCWLPSIA